MLKARVSICAAAMLILTLVAMPAFAQKAGQIPSQSGVIPVYDSAHEVTVQGNIENVVTGTTWGGPLGTHLVVATPRGPVDAHLGPFATKGPNALNLHAGEAVQMVGAMAMIEGKEVLLARTLTVGGQTRVIRNERGFLVQPGAPGASRSKTSEKGGLR